MRFVEKVWRMWESIDTLNLFWAKNTYKDIAEDVETRSDISNYEIDDLYLWEKIKRLLV